MEKAFLLIGSIAGAIFTVPPWATAPFIGEIRGINNGTGIFSLLCFIVIAILALISLGSIHLSKGIKIASAILGGCAGVAASIFIMNVKDADEKMVRASSNLYFGNILEPGLFAPKPGAYFAAITGFLIAVICIFYAIGDSADAVVTES